MCAFVTLNKKITYLLTYLQNYGIVDSGKPHIPSVVGIISTEAWYYTDGPL